MEVAIGVGSLLRSVSKFARFMENLMRSLVRRFAEKLGEKVVEKRVSGSFRNSLGEACETFG